MTRLVRLLFVALCAACTSWPALAAELASLTLSDGTEIEYQLVLPAGFDRDRSYPAILAFPGGRQTLESVEAGLARYWETEARRRGYIVFSPAAPAGRPFYQSGVDLVPEFLERQRAAFNVQDGKFHVVGSSNGAVSAFVVASRHPELFLSLTALAGFPEEQQDFEALDRLKQLNIALFVGELDLYWKAGMQRTRDRLLTLGHAVDLEIVPRNGHLLPDLSFGHSTRIFDRIGCGAICAH